MENKGKLILTETRPLGRSRSRMDLAEIDIVLIRLRIGAIIIGEPL